MPQEAPYGSHKFLSQFVSLRRLATDHAVPSVVLKQSEPHPVESGLNSSDLGNDVYAMPIVFDHVLDPSDLTFDPPETLSKVFLVGGIAVGVSLGRQFGSFRVQPKQFAIRSHHINYPRGVCYPRWERYPERVLTNPGNGYDCNRNSQIQGPWDVL